MRVDVLADPAAVAQRAAAILCATLAAKPEALLGLPTGATPLLLYAELNGRAARGACDFSRSVVYALDEFAGPAREAPGTNAAYYRRHIAFAPRALHCPNSAAEDPLLHISAFADNISRAGGLDLCLLGIGLSGHIAFNEPGSPRDAPARVVTLVGASRDAHAAAFGGPDHVPHEGMTLGVADILQSRRVLLLATGAAKADVVRRAIEEPPGAAVPASWLQHHPDASWLLDQAAAAALSPSRDAS